jgi:superfamily II DNA/RNA helicase
MKELPDVNRTKLYAALDEMQDTLYSEELDKFAEWYNDLVMTGEEDGSSMAIIAKLARMRHLVGLAKIPATMAFVDEFLENTDRKLTIFVHHKDVGSILIDECKKRGIPVFKIVSEMSPPERFQTQELFNKTPKCILIASTLAAGEGLNLQSCGDAIMHERQWNPQNEEQAAPGRFRRIGTTHTVINVTFPLASGTVDSILDGIVDRKRHFFHAVMNEGKAVEFGEGQIMKEVAEELIKDWKKKKNFKIVTKPKETTNV